jgi:formate-dependent nitrite reductase membrane component NrfD
MQHDVMGTAGERLSAYKRNVAETFEIGFAAQKDWKIWEVLAFYLGGVGAGLYVVSQFLHLTSGLVVGYVLVVWGKNIAHLLASSRPERSIRAFANLRTSWISRGAFFILLFAVFGRGDIAVRLGWNGGVGESIEKAVALLTGLCAAMVMLYIGFVMAQSRIIPLWHSPLLPVTLLSYSLALGAALAGIIAALRGDNGNAGTLDLMLFITTVVTMFLILMPGLVLRSSSKTARVSVELLTKGRLRVMFVGGVLIFGLGVPILLTAYSCFGEGTHEFFTFSARLLTLGGGFLFESALLKAAIFSPSLPVE